MCTHIDWNKNHLLTRHCSISLILSRTGKHHWDWKPEAVRMRQRFNQSGYLEIEPNLYENCYVFGNYFLSGLPAKAHSLRIDLTYDSSPVEVWLLNYSKEQKMGFMDMPDKFVHHEMEYPNPTSSYAWDLLLVPKCRLTKFRIRLYLYPVNRFAVKHYFPMPYIEHDLCKLSGFRYLTTFEFSNGYWKLYLELSKKLSRRAQPGG